MKIYSQRDPKWANEKLGFGETTVRLGNGGIAIIDKNDIALVEKYNWFSHKEGNNTYAYANILLKNGKRTCIKMHRILLGLKNIKSIADHKNKNGLDNRRENLRVCTKSQNAQNKRKLPNRSSKYKGVCFDKSRNVWISYIRKDYKMINLGRFNSEEDAARSYDAKAKDLFGEYASINF